jgi:hypothetical protein
MENKELQAAREYGLPSRIKSKIQAVLEEQLAYAADELVELTEEILHQLSAVAISHYLENASQKEVYNDFLIQLFNSSGHDYNAGTLYRWSANMIKELEENLPKEHFEFYWKEGRLNDEVHHLAMLRNEVMHGFFVLPPERNLNEATSIGELLNRLVKSSLFEVKKEYHFLNSDGYTGHWKITRNEQWDLFKGKNSFGQLCERIMQENSESFWQKQNEVFQAEKIKIPGAIQDFVINNDVGAMGVWLHPNDLSSFDLYTSIGFWLNQQKVSLVAYQLHDQGLSYTGSFLLNRLIQVLNVKGNDVSRNKKSEEIVKKLRQESKETKVVVLIHQIEVALFSPQHVTTICNFLYKNDILLVAVGIHYEHFNGFFNSSIFVEFAREVPSFPTALKTLHKYLRFKGPSKDREEERFEVGQLEQILEKVLFDLNSGQSLYARRFADENGYEIEYVHEIFALLHPWIQTKREPFEADTVDELYGFPSNMTEVTPIYLALGRRDLKLEYQHKVISL